MGEDRWKKGTLKNKNVKKKGRWRSLKTEKWGPAKPTVPRSRCLSGLWGDDLQLLRLSCFWMGNGEWGIGNGWNLSFRCSARHEAINERYYLFFQTAEGSDPASRSCILYPLSCILHLTLPPALFPIPYSPVHQSNLVVQGFNSAFLSICCSEPLTRAKGRLAP